MLAMRQKVIKIQQHKKCTPFRKRKKSFFRFQTQKLICFFMWKFWTSSIIQIKHIALIPSRFCLYVFRVLTLAQNRQRVYPGSECNLDFIRGIQLNAVAFHLIIVWIQFVCRFPIIVRLYRYLSVSVWFVLECTS